MLAKNQRQLGKSAFLIGLVVVLSCVSRTTPERRVTESLALASSSTFTLASGDPARFTFAAVGDLHIGGGGTDRFRDILNAAAADGDEFVLLLGDLVDEGKESDVLAMRQAIQDTGWDGKVFCVAGNHDIFYDGWENYKNHNGSSTYSFVAGNSKFIGLDTADGTLGSRQIQWLKGELAQSTQENIFLFSHYLPVVPGVETYLRLANDTESNLLMSLASRNGVKGWLGAHYHSYILQAIDGVSYLVAGGGGGRRMPPVLGYFYARVSVNGSQVSFERKEVQ